MKNLAGNEDCDDFIELELRRAGIDPIECEKHNGEVSYSITGKLGPFLFTRAWTYWMVSGNVPLPVAEELYANPTGKEVIRVTGHCGCPPPKEWATEIGGKKFVTSYHIDTQGGLTLFADTLRKHSLV